MVGRPTVITPEVLEKLENAFMMGLSDQEACLLAKIDPKTLYNYCDKNPDFSSKKEHLKSNPKLIAKLNVFDKLQKGDVELSKWYLERRARDEFSTKQEIKGEITSENIQLEEIAQSMRKIAESN